MAMRFTITVEGSSKTTILSDGGTPIARFYAGRFTPELLAEIERKLNAAEQVPA